MILKTPQEIALMRNAGRVVAQTLKTVSAGIRPGVSPQELNDFAHELITKAGGKPSFLGYRDFPAAACISVNDVVVHGIPNAIPLREGDIVTLDFGVYLEGFHADSAWTFPVGDISSEAAELLKETEASLYEGISYARAGARLGDVGAAVQRHVESHGFSVVRDLVGHGIGRSLHEEPSVPNYGKPGRGPVLQVGSTICIEPMVNAGTWRVNQLDDGWTIVTADGSLSAHFEHTVAITEEGPQILTAE